MLKSLDSYEFKKTLLDFFADDADATSKLSSVDWESWYNKPGYPPKPKYDDSLVRACYDLAAKWQKRSGSPFQPTSNDIAGWSANQSVVFLEKLQSAPEPLRVEDVELMGSAYGYAVSENVELVSRYYGVGLQAKAKSVYQPTADLLGRVGRMKFVRPLYRLLAECDRALAVETFEKNRSFYHPICRGLVEKDLFGDAK
jgi:leukotriene-A4 hydrolase